MLIVLCVVIPLGYVVQYTYLFQYLLYLNNKRRKRCWFVAVIIISTLKGYFIPTVFIKCPITERCEKIKIINYRSTSWAIYSGLQPSNTLSRCSLAMNQTKSSKKGFTHQSSLHFAQKNVHYSFWPTILSEWLATTRFITGGYCISLLV